MAISLHTITSTSRSRTAPRRNGRGLGRKGTTAGRGQKGQKSRTGVGGLKRLGMRKLLLSTPKLRGFRSLAAKMAVVNVSDLARYIAGEVVSPRTLAKKGLITSTKYGVKICGSGDMLVAVTIKGCEVTKSAAEKIAKAGGKVA